MQIHQVVGLNGPESLEKLGREIERLYPLNHTQIADRVWLVAGDATTKEVSDALGITDGEDGIAGLVTLVGGYFGRAPTGLWEWLKVKIESKSDGKPAVAA
jgi:hypothetical protein